MSGIVGWVDWHRDLRTEEEVVRRMTEALRARGPDGGGVWLSPQAALGHRRLSTGGAGGEQPLTLDGVTAVLDGYLANAAELRRELGARSDIETVVRAYLRWGAALAERLDGSFAFAVWDGRELVLGRDRFGIKPLYSFAYPDGLLFASEPKAILANPRFQPRMELSSLPVLLQPRLALPGETPLVGLREVPAAHVVRCSPSGASSRRYWQLTAAAHGDGFEDTAAQVRALLQDAVRRALPDGAPPGAMLSGGLDSTSVTALALDRLRTGDPASTLDTFCLGFAGDALHFVPTELRPDIDAPYAAAAAEFLGTRHHALTASMVDLEAVIPATRRARDLPGWGQFDASMYLLFREMSGGCKVGLTGEAADEIFGGYPYCFNPAIVDRRQFPWLGDGPRLSDYLSPAVTQVVDVRTDEHVRWQRLVAEVPRLPGEDPADARMREVLYLGMCGPLSVILDRKERMSAAHGLEVRVPYLDHHLVEYVWNAPWSMKSRGGAKGLLKAALGDLLPRGTLDRKKSAYPHLQSPEHERALINEALRIVEDRRAHIATLFDRPRLQALIGELAAGGRAAGGRMLPGGATPAYLLIHLIELEHWIHDYKVSIC